MAGLGLASRKTADDARAPASADDRRVSPRPTKPPNFFRPLQLMYLRIVLYPHMRAMRKAAGVAPPPLIPSS